MKEHLKQYWAGRWLILVGGVVLWGLLAAGAALFATMKGLPVWPVIVTWDEWVAALVTLPMFVMAALGIFTPEEFKGRRTRAVMRALYLVSPAVAVVFVLDLISRAVLGLGWQPF